MEHRNDLFANGQNDDDEYKPPFYGYCPMGGISKPFVEWPRCVGGMCAWFEGTNLVCALTCIAFYAS